MCGDLGLLCFPFLHRLGIARVEIARCLALGFEMRLAFLLFLESLQGPLLALLDEALDQIDLVQERTVLPLIPYSSDLFLVRLQFFLMVGDLGFGRSTLGCRRLELGFDRSHLLLMEAVLIVELLHPVGNPGQLAFARLQIAQGLLKLGNGA